MEEKTYKGNANRPVDMGEKFKNEGWEYCKYLITDPRSDAYLKRESKK
tara:strand:+ start:2784 stop:2927 length:144 start_codon:yes stop_codon:yes gene_type:complete